MPDAPSHLRPTSLPGFPFGCAYYPEHTEEARWRSDAERMAAAGMNLVRVAEFAWTLMEPRPDAFDFSLFERVADLFSEHGIDTMLCTPTAAPPRWFTVAHPDSLRVDGTGRRLHHGSRQHVSAMHPAYRERSVAITRAMAQHFKHHPRVTCWQTDNEFHCHFHEDHSEPAQRGFQAWCADRYGDVSALNEAWGTVFWSQQYDRFEDVVTPRLASPTHLNPAHRLAYTRFLSDATVAFQAEQVRELRGANPSWWITHNGVFADLDYRELAGDLDVLGFDSYPMFFQDPAVRPLRDAARLDRIRGWSGNFVIPEQQSGAGGQSDYMLDAPAPGEMRQLALRAVARGCDGLMFFRWRTARVGAEQHWLGLLDADDRPTRRYNEAARLGAELKELAPRLRGSHVRCEAAVAGADFTLHAGFDACHLGLDRPEWVAEDVHHGLTRAQVAAGVVHPADDLTGVKLYVLPNFTLFDPAWVPALEAWVRAGGHLVIGAMTASRDRRNNLIPGTPPGCLAPLAGVRVDRSARVNEPAARPLEAVFGGVTLPAWQWVEALTPDPAAGTRVLAQWSPAGGPRAFDDGFSGLPAVTSRPLGAGRVVYAGTAFSPEAVAAWLPVLLEAAGVQPLVGGLPAGVEAVRRDGPAGPTTFLLNLTEAPLPLPGVKGVLGLLDGGGDGGDTTTLPPFGVGVFGPPAA